MSYTLLLALALPQSFDTSLSVQDIRAAAAAATATTTTTNKNKI
jgi:hypothetical protein